LGFCGHTPQREADLIDLEGRLVALVRESPLLMRALRAAREVDAPG
jgi:hypothetical protein